MIGAVVPAFNRRANLELLLASLEEQTTHDFTLVVADDGSTDGTRELVEDLARTPRWSNRLRWIGCGPNLGVRTGRARNIGAANLPGGTSLLVMLDSDLVLQPQAMELFTEAHRRHPDSVLFGGVDWLPPLGQAEVLDAVRSHQLPTLRARIPAGAPTRIEGTFAGPELRAGFHNQLADQPAPLRPGWALPLNSGWPLHEYWRSGGFDELMQGYGYQDMELGARAARAGLTCLPRPELWALHVWHPKPAKAMHENQRNLDRYLRRHGDFLRRSGFGDDLEVDVDWTLWWHYHAERGGTVIQADGQLWAISRDRSHRLALPDNTWLARLGHGNLSAADEVDLDRTVGHGIATDAA